MLILPSGSWQEEDDNCGERKRSGDELMAMTMSKPSTEGTEGDEGKSITKGHSNQYTHKESLQHLRISFGTKEPGRAVGKVCIIVEILLHLLLNEVAYNKEPLHFLGYSALVRP